MKKEKELSEIINEIKNKLPKENANDLVEYYEQNEWSLTFEELCSQLSENKIPITSEFYNKISSCGKFLNIKSFYWESLKELIKQGTKKLTPS